MDLELLMEELWTYAASDPEELERKIRSSLKGHSADGLLKAVTHSLGNGQHLTAKTLLIDYVQSHSAAHDIQRRLELILHFKKHRAPQRLSLKSKQRDKETLLQEINHLVATSKLRAAEELLLEVTESVEDPDYLQLLSRVYMLQRRPVEGAEAMQRALVLKRQQQAFIVLPEDEQDPDIPSKQDLAFISKSAEALTSLEIQGASEAEENNPVTGSLRFIEHTASEYPPLTHDGWWDSQPEIASRDEQANGDSGPNGVLATLPESENEASDEQRLKTDDVHAIPTISILKLTNPKKENEAGDTATGVKVFNKRGRLLNVMTPVKPEMGKKETSGLLSPRGPSDPDLPNVTESIPKSAVESIDDSEHQPSPCALDTDSADTRLADTTSDTEGHHATEDFEVDGTESTLDSQSPEADNVTIPKILVPPEYLPPVVTAPSQTISPGLDEGDEEEEEALPLEDLEIDVPKSHLRSSTSEDEADPYDLDFESPDLTIDEFENYTQGNNRPALFELDDFDSDFEIYAFDPDEVFDDEDVSTVEPTDWFASKLSREDRAFQKAAELIGMANWPLSALPLVQQIFTMSGWGATRLALEREIAKGLTPEELILASHIKVLWAENDMYWIAFDRSGSSSLSYYVLSWPAALLIVRSFDAIPQVEEIDVLLEELFEYWYESKTLRRTFKAFGRYLWFRFANLPGCLPANQRFNYCNPSYYPSEEYSDLGLHDELDIEKDEKLRAYGVFQVKHPQEPGCYFSDKPVITEKPSLNSPRKQSEPSSVVEKVSELLEEFEEPETTSDDDESGLIWAGTGTEADLLEPSASSLRTE